MISDELLYQSAPLARELCHSTFPSKDEVPQHTFSRRFERKMNKLIRQQRRSLPFHRFLRIFKYFPLALLVAAVVSLTVWLAISPHSMQFLQETNTLQDDSRYVRMDYIPSAMDHETIEENTNEQLQVRYFNDSGDYFHVTVCFLQKGENAPTLAVPEGAQVSEVELNGNHAMQYSKDNILTLVWSNQRRTYHLEGSLPAEEMLRIAQAIK